MQLQSHVGRGLATGAQIKRLGLQGGMVHVASGNFVIAQPMGVLDGVDMMFVTYQDAACCVYICRRLIDLSLIAGTSASQSVP